MVRRAWLGAKGQRKRGKNADAENYEKCCNDFCLPDKDSLQSDLTGPGYSYTSDGRLQPEGKDAIRKRGMPQPVEGDAIAHQLTHRTACEARRCIAHRGQVRAQRGEEVVVREGERTPRVAGHAG